MPKLYKNPKLVIPVALMAVLAGLTFTSVRYLNAIIDVFTSGFYKPGQDPYFITYVLEIFGRLAFPALALASIIVLFATSRKGLLTVVFGLTFIAGFIPHLVVNLYLLLVVGWEPMPSFFQVSNWWTMEFDITLALYHSASYLAIAVFVLYLVLASIKPKSAVGTSAPLVAAQPASPQVIVGYDTTTGQPIYGKAPTEN